MEPVETEALWLAPAGQDRFKEAINSEHLTTIKLIDLSINEWKKKKKKRLFIFNVFVFHAGHIVCYRSTVQDLDHLLAGLRSDV